jgi:hypothetical protein
VAICSVEPRTVTDVDATTFNGMSARSMNWPVVGLRTGEDHDSKLSALTATEYELPETK